ncbi:class I SAM-dependent methyltransferase [Calothrix sp. NIES-3974]|uniref:class I SAM-dependent methyltransferase n=1 Tax=Calothrix sp. NIES-3974 TaxID=2005462 RepID=UPI000B5E3569|nr:methyltransferase domain-containing protein [Calothrix sp. NIES-3974]BAZ07218.1 hypothetical protein NIES3974_38810 [Calothrix sp. NIES-3974]
MTITRQDYQVNRLNFLQRFIKLETSQGLEIGACDLPTVPVEIGNCEFADSRSSEELINLWNLPPETVVPVKYVLAKDTPIYLQIEKKFDYVVLCHVIEHIPNVIGYIQDLQNLLKPGGVLVIACPDKRRTPDTPTPSTTVEHLIQDYYENCQYPSLEHILHFGKAWSEEVKQKSIKSAHSLYEWGRQHLESGNADIHCHVWTDEEFFQQIEYLVDGKILDGLKIIDKLENHLPYHEFLIALQLVETSATHELSNYCQHPTVKIPANPVENYPSPRELELMQRIAAMESSKFWKLRTHWFKLKKMLGIQCDE